jgi:putative copper export protein
VTKLDYIKWAHLLGAAVWTGGLITLAALVVSLRRAGADRSMLQAAARQFGRVSWSALALIVGTGIWQVETLGLPWSYGRLVFKLVLVGIVAALALLHQVTAKQTSAAVRGALQGVILVLSIGVFGAATRLL